MAEAGIGRCSVVSYVVHMVHGRLVHAYIPHCPFETRAVCKAGAPTQHVFLPPPSHLRCPLAAVRNDPSVSIHTSRVSLQKRLHCLGRSLRRQYAEKPGRPLVLTAHAPIPHMERVRFAHVHLQQDTCLLPGCRSICCRCSAPQRPQMPLLRNKRRDLVPIQLRDCAEVQ